MELRRVAWVDSTVTNSNSMALNSLNRLNSSTPKRRANNLLIMNNAWGRKTLRECMARLGGAALPALPTQVARRAIYFLAFNVVGRARKLKLPKPDSGRRHNVVLAILARGRGISFRSCLHQQGSSRGDTAR